MHVKGVERPVPCIVVGDLDVQVKTVLQFGVTTIERTVGYRLIGNACHFDLLRLVGLCLLGLLLHRRAAIRAARRGASAASHRARQHGRKRHGGNSYQQLLYRGPHHPHRSSRLAAHPMPGSQVNPPASASTMSVWRNAARAKCPAAQITAHQQPFLAKRARIRTPSAHKTRRLSQCSAPANIRKM